MKQGRVPKRVMIVDDNQLVLSSMEKLIPWAAHGFELIGTAKDGQKAWELIGRNGHADIMITDIKMPVKDGLELIREVREQGVDTKAIMLSSYSDFALVREAMRLGASEYILKTELEADRLLELLQKLSRELDEERDELAALTQKDERLEQYMSRVREADSELYRNRRPIKDQMYRELCRGNMTEAQFKERALGYLDIRFGERCRAVLYVSADQFQKLLEARWGSNEQLFSFAVLNIMNELTADTPWTDVFYYGFGDFVVLNSNPEITAEQLKAWGAELFAVMSQALESLLRLGISGGLCLQGERGDTLPQLFLRALQICQHRYLAGKGQLLQEEDVRQSPEEAGFREQEKVELLRNALRAFHSEHLENVMYALVLGPEQVTLSSIDAVRKLYEKYSYVIDEFLEQQGFRGELGGPLDQLSEAILDRESLPALNRSLSALLHKIASRIASGNTLTRKILYYIREHYREEISVQTASEHLGISSVHLGRLMQKELSVHFTEYVNQLRIEQAKKLLAQGGMKVYEIAEYVGYSSTEYFSRVFKKMTGVSPKEYSGR